MPPDVIKNSELWGPLFAFGVVISMILIAIIVSFGSKVILNHRTDPDRRDDHIPIDILILTTLRGPLVFFTVMIGFVLGFTVLTELTHPAFDFFNEPLYSLNRKIVLFLVGPNVVSIGRQIELLAIS